MPHQSPDGAQPVSRWRDGFVAVDCGTTNRRAYLVDAQGRIAGKMEDDRGVLAVPAGGFAAAVDTIRQRFGGKPLLMAGMVGSNRGWQEAPYVACPAALADLAGRLAWVEPGEIAIVPGMSVIAGTRADVMRGEEVQIFGVRALGQAGARATLCHPGTHTKWITLDGDCIVDFRTVMTGELFSLLKGHSILAPLLEQPAAVDDAFFAGVDQGYASGAADAELFSARARVLLGLSAPADAASFVSGILIGCNLRTGLAAAGEGSVAVLGQPALTRLYAAAIARCGRVAHEIDGSGAFVAGMRAIAEMIG